MWPNNKLLDFVGLDLPIIQAPMAGAGASEMAIATSEAGGLGSLPCGTLDAQKAAAASENLLFGVWCRRTFYSASWRSRALR